MKNWRFWRMQKEAQFNPYSRAEQGCQCCAAASQDANGISWNGAAWREVSGSRHRCRYEGLNEGGANSQNERLWNAFARAPQVGRKAVRINQLPTRGFRLAQLNRLT